MESSGRFDALLLNVNAPGNSALPLGNNIVGQQQFGSSSCGCNGNKSLPLGIHPGGEPQGRPPCKPGLTVTDHGVNCSQFFVFPDCNHIGCSGTWNYSSSGEKLTCNCNMVS